MCNGRQELGHCPVLASKWVNPTSATRASKWVNPISAREMTESPVPVDHHTYLLFKFLKYAAAILLGRHVRDHCLRSSTYLIFIKNNHSEQDEKELPFCFAKMIQQHKNIEDKIDHDTMLYDV